MSLQNITYTDKKDTRSGFGVGIHEAGKANENVVALCADLIGSLKLEKFIEDFPERFIQPGIAEANMIGIAAGLAIGDKIPVATTFANFGTGRVYDQIRQSVAYSDKNVKICCSHAGLTLGEDGATHQILEDIGLMKMLPHMTVVVPCDYNQTRLATKAIIEKVGPTYLRFGRPVWPIFTPAEDETVQIGNYANIKQEPILNFNDIKSELSKLDSMGFKQTVNFVETSNENNLVCQFFEFDNTTLGKLDVIDFGSFEVEDGTTKHVFFCGKVFIDNNGLNTYVNMFTLVFDSNV